MDNKSPLTLDKYAKTILQYNINKTADLILDDDDFSEYLGKKYPKPTRRDIIKWWFADKKQRCKDIWTILSGGNIHEDCGY